MAEKAEAPAAKNSRETDCPLLGVRGEWCAPLLFKRFNSSLKLNQMKIWAFEFAWLRVNHLPSNLSSLKTISSAPASKMHPGPSVLRKNYLDPLFRSCSTHAACFWIVAQFVDLKASRDWQDGNREKWGWLTPDHSWNLRVGGENE